MSITIDNTIVVKIFEQFQMKIVLTKPEKTQHNPQKMFPPGIEPGTICVLGRCDNHYTTET